ncbi:MAG: exonuclease domain-containing protein [Bacteroidota bacterium]
MFDAFQRQRYRRRVSGGPMRAFLDAPPPDPRTPLGEVELLSLDLETTGLDPKRDAILSVGSVPVAGGAVKVGQSAHVLVRADRSVAQSATVHGLLDCDVEEGISLEDALAHVLERLAGRVLLAHHAVFDHGCLDHACRVVYGVPLLVPTVDTLAIARRRHHARAHQHHGTAAPDAFRLATLREAHGLPAYHAHNALSDALATAELFLAMIAEDATLRLKDVL